MASLSQVSQNSITSPNRRAADVLQALLDRPFIRALDRASAFVLDTTNFNFTAISGNVAATARAIGSSFTPRTVTPEGLQVGSQSLYGYATQMDLTHVLDEAQNAAVARRLLDKHVEDAITWAENLEAEFFAGTGADNRMSGLAALTPALPGFDVSVRNRTVSLAPAGAGSLDINTTDGLLELYRQLMIYRARIPNANAIVVNDIVWSRLEMIARDNRVYNETADQFGNLVGTFGGVPLVPLSATAIPNTEANDGTPTAANDTTSVYILALNPATCGIVTNSGLYYREWDHVSQGENAKEVTAFHCAWRIQSHRSVLRLRHIKAV